MWSFEKLCYFTPSFLTPLRSLVFKGRLVTGALLLKVLYRVSSLNFSLGFRVAEIIAYLTLDKNVVNV